jgi:hypothetical protein
VPGFGSRLRAIRGTRVDRIGERKKDFCCVTTRGRNVWILPRLGLRLGALAARTLSLCVPCFDLRGLAMFGLSSRGLPAADESQSFRMLAIKLIPAPRLVLAATSFAKTTSPTRSAVSQPCRPNSLT